MFRGRYQLGQEVPLGVLAVNGSNTPSFPTIVPHMDVFSSTGKVIAGKLLPVLDRGGQTGYFQIPLFLGPQFVAGKYTAVYRWLVGTYLGQSADEFDVLAGGSTDGSIIAMHWFERPQAQFIVQHLDSGKVLRSRNPRV